MIFNNILSKEELEALLTPEELEVFKAEQQDLLEHEIMLSPAHLLMGLRELERTVGRLTERVQQLELQLVPKTLLLESNQDEATDELEPYIDEPYLVESYTEPLNNSYLEIQAEQEQEQEPESESESEPNIEEMENSALVNVELLEPSLSEVASSSSSPEETKLISRSARHRERKPSIFGRLLK
jgi:hypothetical protein